MGVNILFIGDFWVESAIFLKRNVASISILRIIIGKFCYWKNSRLMILFIVDKRPEIGLHYTILHFCLPVCMGVEDDRESWLDVSEIAWQLLEL